TRLPHLLLTPLEGRSVLCFPFQCSGRNRPRCLPRPTANRSTPIPAARLHRGPLASRDLSDLLAWKCPARPAVCRPPPERERSAGASTIVVARHWQSDFPLQRAPVSGTCEAPGQLRTLASPILASASWRRGTSGILKPLSTGLLGIQSGRDGRSTSPGRACRLPPCSRRHLSRFEGIEGSDRPILD